MLNAFTIICAQIFLNLSAASLAFFIQRNTDFAVRRCHRTAGEASIFALDIEIADLAEVKYAFVKAAPMRHAAAINIVRQVIDNLETSADGIAIHTGQIVKINIVNGQSVAIAVHQINHRAANAANGGQAKLHGTSACFNRLSTPRNRLVIGNARILHPKRHAAGRWPMFSRKIGRRAFGFVIGDQIDFALPPQIDIL